MSPTRKTSPTAKRSTKPSRQDLAEALAERDAELAEARSQQAATAEILRVISRSKADAAPVFDSIVLAAVRSLRCDMAAVLLRDGEVYYQAAGATPEGLLDLAPFRVPIDSSANFPSRAFLARETLYLPDWSQIDLPEHERSVQAAFGVNSALYLPLMREGESIGLIVALGNRSNAFGPKEIVQAESFRDQAVIAIENSRLFDEVQARTRDLEEALEQQTATADVLKAISRAAFDLDTVLDSLISTALRLCNARQGQIFRRHGDVYRYAASRMDVDPAYREHERTTAIKPGRGTLIGRVALENRTVHIADAWNDPEYAEKDEARIGNVRAMLGVPLMRNGEPIGAFALARDEPVPFTQRQVELVTTFADQAVIAIENVRLFDEVQAKTRDLSEALQQQTATADVLKVISRSAFDLQSVFNTLISSAVELVGGTRGSICVRDTGGFRWRANFGATPEFARYLAENRPVANNRSAVGRVLLTGRVAAIEDVLKDSDYALPSNLLNQTRSVLAAPMLRNEQVEGVLVVSRTQPGSFTKRQIELLQTFADQAVIAIENVRLFDEVQAKTRDLEESLAQQTATTDVLKVISRSAFDLQTVLEALLKAAVELIGGNNGTLSVREGDGYAYRALLIGDEGLRAFLKANPPRPGRHSMAGRVLLSGGVETIPDVREDPDYVAPYSHRDIRAILGVPLLRDGRIEGVVTINRTSPGAFTSREIEGVQSFADQAVIAIENVRLFKEVQAKTRDLSESLERQTATSEILRVISQSPTDAGPVFDRIVTTAARLLHYDYAYVILTDGKEWRPVAGATPGGARAERLPDKYPVDPSADFPSRAIASKAMVHLPDWSLINLPTIETQVRDILGAHSSLYLPFLRDGECVGLLAFVSRRAHAFGPAEIAQAESFRDQALIAIENARLFNETQESLQQQTATADVLKVISRSAFDLQAVLDTLIASAVELAGANRGAIYLRDGEAFRWQAASGADSDYIEYMRSHPRPLNRSAVVGRVALSGRVESIADILEDKELELPASVLARGRGALGVPLLRDGMVEGVIVLSRYTPGPYSQRQIELVQTFADQAVIAIENARLFGQVQAKTRDLEEALERETATSEILRVISQSPTDAQPVFRSIVAAAARSLRCDLAVVLLRDGDVYIHTAGATPQGPMPEFAGYRVPIDPAANFPSRVFLAAETLHLPDWSKIELPEHERAVQAEFGIASALYLPLLREGECIGLIGLVGSRPNAFGPKEIAQAESFRDQAVIAIENARLFDEVQARTRDLSDALQQQTATAEVLKVISRSAFDLDTVFQTLVTTAVNLCNASSGTLCVRDGEVFRYRGQAGPESSTELQKYLQDHPLKSLGRESAAGRAILSGQIEQIPDVLLDSSYAVPLAAHGNPARAILAVPLLGKSRVEGAFVLTRAKPGPYSAREVEILQTFADQAVIAIENARLFDEVQAKTRDLEEALQQQTATADVLKVISRSAFNLKTVLDTLTESAATLCNAEYGLIFLRESGVYRARASFPSDEDRLRSSSADPRSPGRGSVASRVALSGKVEQIPDISTDPEYNLPQQYWFFGPARALLGVPLLRDGRVEGIFVLGRLEPGAFTARQVELVQTFADQAVIAIENTSLFNEVQAKTRDLEEALQQQTATAEVLKVISRSAFDLQAVLTTLAESAQVLCSASFATLSLRDGDAMRLRAESGCTPEIVAFMRAHPIRAGRETFTGRVMLSGEPMHVPDVLADPEYDFGEGPRVGDYRALLAVPLLREGRVEGVFALARPEPIPFTERQVEMVRAFADQAVIAIENARLFGEVQARTRELTQSLDDLRRAQDRLIQSEKLASLGQLTAGIAHEIKNPLNFVNNFSALSRELVGELADVIKAAPLDDARREEADELIGTIGGNLDKVVQHGKRADSIVKNMLLHSREGSGERSETNINAMVEEALNLAYHGARAEKPGFNVTIVKSLDPGAGDAEVYAQEMTRVLLNLISNGFYATAKRKQADPNGAYEPTLTATTRDLGKSVEIVIRDNGTGIPDEVKEKMFNPFFTTKPAGEGTGLGLSLSHDIVVKQHGGTLEVSTEPGAYTEFTIGLPRTGGGQ